MLWQSTLQMEIALSAIESEFVALSISCKDLFPIMDLVKEIGTFFDLPIEDKVRFHVRIHEDNVGALLLGQCEPCRMTPHLKTMQLSNIGSVNNWACVELSFRKLTQQINLVIFSRKGWDALHSSICRRS